MLKYVLGLFLFMTLSFFLTSCGDSKEPPVASITQIIEDEDNNTVGIAGGKVSVERAFVDISPHTLSKEYNLTIQTFENTTFDKGQTLQEFFLKDLPEDFSKPIQLAVAQGEEGDDLILLKIETFIKSQNETVTKSRIVRGEVENGYIIYTFYPDATTKVTASKQRSVVKYLEIGWAALKGYKTLDTKKGHFRIFFPDAYVNEALDMEEILEDVYSYYGDMGFDLTKRKSWPMEINIKPFSGSDKHAYGFYSQSKRGCI